MLISLVLSAAAMTALAFWTSSKNERAAYAGLAVAVALAAIVEAIAAGAQP